jgi:O-antigen/teichoic acid export membrane protein
LVSLRRTLPAGLVDAGLASLATFGTGLYAARELTPRALGVYALFFSAFKIVGLLPSQLVFTPAQVSAVSADGPRLRYFWACLPLGTGLSLLASLGVLAVSLVIPGEVSAELVLGMAATTGLAAFLSPIQDHTRRMLHISKLSWRAASVSVVQLSVVVVTLVVLIAVDAPVSWIPFGSLAMANLVSLFVGMALAQASSARVGPALHFGELARSGRWLLLVGLVASGGEFLAGTLVSHLADLSALGYAEAARVIGRPLPVLALGLSAVLGPRSMQAAAQRRPERARRARNVSLAVLSASGLVYLLVAGVAWSWNPLAWLVPKAYVVSGLAAVTILGNTINGFALPRRFELMGGRRERRLARAESLTTVLEVAFVFTAPWTQSFAIAGGNLIGKTTRWLAFRRAMAGHYRDVGTPVEPPAAQSRIAATAPAGGVPPQG